MSHTAVTPTGAPTPPAPFSYGVRTRRVVYLSGQVGIDLQSGTLVEGGLPAQTRQAFANVEAILTAAGLTLADIVKVTVLLADIGDWPEVNTLYAAALQVDVLPARTAYQVGALPLGALIELDVIAEP